MKVYMNSTITPLTAGFLFFLAVIAAPAFAAALVPQPTELVSQGERIVGQRADQVTSSLSCSSGWRSTPAKTKHGDAYTYYVCVESNYQLYADDAGKVFAFGRPLVDEAFEPDYFARLVVLVKQWEDTRCQKLRGTRSSWVGQCEDGKAVALLARPPRTSDKKRRDIVLIWGEVEMLSKMLGLSPSK